ncbi:uncharacterized protein CLAFUR5_00757 [Fulvia fulva]|uniref:Uncharacterized protein n=1 Tax=Passalora fulva TaxID=5499 RepID=A0A9Q8P4L9_PASFU|nr:uncharacterized protein CLAFUR5_00757 [Fulvia fulva]KAK4638312.1 hypothetical protein CLAFUR0_00756 [Fulvia fulva]UJO13004.1 hypothetical protein CLAFUR5_00757 [Fulvia fulva]
MEDPTQTLQNWLIFASIIGGVAWYYWPKGKTVPKPAQAAKEVKKDVKKAARKLEKPKTLDTGVKSTEQPQSYADAAKEDAAEHSNKKRKTAAQQGYAQAASNAVVERKDAEEDIDMSTRQFAANMQKARQGIQVKSTNNKETRVKTVKAKSPVQAPTISSGSSQQDADEEWSSASVQAQAGGVEDMLEPAAPGPSALRITASEKPTKDKVNKQSKKQEVETKKQRQNRKKTDDARLAREEADREQKANMEKQRRIARESRGEPAKNGVPISSAPVTNPWKEQNAAREAQISAVGNTGAPAQLLDTFETESNSSSHQEPSTAATSVTDATPEVATVVGSDTASDTTPRYSEQAVAGKDEYAKAITESEQDSGWNEVKVSKKSKKSNSNSNTKGDATPVAAPVANGKQTKGTANSRRTMFSALGDNEA